MLGGRFGHFYRDVVKKRNEYKVKNKFVSQQMKD